jgi:predicted nucleotidyltransferase
MADDTLAARIAAAMDSLTPEQSAEVTGAVERLIDALQPEQIYVFGSYARGDATADSDVDLFVIVADSTVPAHRRARTAYEAVGPHRLPLDILVMPRTEFDRRRVALASLPATVLREGRLLYAA